MLAFDEDERFALVEGVIAERHRVHADGQKLLEDRFGETEAAGRVLSIDDHEIEAPARGTCSMTAARPERPTTSPMKRRRIQRSPTKMVSCSVTMASRL